MNIKHLLSFVALAASLSAAAPSFAALSVANGSFEANTANGACAASWTCVNGSSFGEEPVSFWDGQLSGSNLAASPNGGNVLATWFIDQGNSISQSLTGLAIGSTYTVSFDDASANRWSRSAGNGFVGWQVSVGGAVLGTSSVAIAAADSATPWKSESMTFVASATSEVLKFLSTSTVAVAPEPLLLLDGVNVQPQVAPVPEPSTWVLMVAGFCAIAGIVRRRQHQAGRA